MAFLNIPLKAIQAEVLSVIGTETMPWYNPLDFPVPPGNPTPAPVQKDYRWRITMSIDEQQQSSYLTRSPGVYNGQDITVGQWIANINSGQAWQIITIEAKTETTVTAIVQDIYRYNTFRDPAGTGNGGPSVSTYVIFSLSDSGYPQIDPIPPAGISALFTQNIQSRFNYINLQYDYPLYQAGNTFAVNDTIATDANTNSFVKSDVDNKMVIGRVTSISDTIPGWFTINPVQKIVDFLDYLPGGIGDIIYSSTTNPGEVTTVEGGTPIYVKLRDQTSSISTAGATGPTTPGNVFQLNGVNITVGGSGTSADIQTAVNAQSLLTGVSASLNLQPTVIVTNPLQLSFYGEVVLDSVSPATATINGVSVTFNIQSSVPGYTGYTQSPQMAQSINNANIPNIVASAPNTFELVITNTIGGPITIVNVTNDGAGVPFAGPASGTGLPLSTPASTNYQLVFTAVDARAINFLDVYGSTLLDFGINSVENGIKACGLYIEGGLRTPSSSVVANLAQLNALNPLIGDQAYVIDSDDGSGNHVGEWSMWLYDGVQWTEIGNQDSATTDAKSIEYTLTTASPTTINIGEISTGRRVTLITVEVTQSFDGPATLSIGYIVNNPSLPVTAPSGLMASSLIDLTATGTYTTQTDVLFGSDTPQGDVSITGNFVVSGASQGSAQIIVSYV